MELQREPLVTKKKNLKNEIKLMWSSDNIAILRGDVPLVLWGPSGPGVHARLSAGPPDGGASDLPAAPSPRRRRWNIWIFITFLLYFLLFS